MGGSKPSRANKSDGLIGVKVTDFLYKYQKSLNDRINEISIALTSGNASDMASYKAMVGEIQGLSYALEQLRTLLEKTDNDIDST